MIRNLINILALLFMISSCKPEAEVLDMPEEVLAKVLADVHIVEGALLSIRPVEKDSMKLVYYDQIFEIHQISKESFERNLNVLKKNPRMMEEIYNKVMEELTLKEKEEENKKDKKEKK